MDGSDHMNSVQMPIGRRGSLDLEIPIGRRGSLDLENERLAEGHAAPMDGQDFEVVDWLGFPPECFF
jgi:hypothetical protein